MYINSNFTDYYDFCTKFGQDPKIVYNRKTSQVEIGRPPSLLRLDPSDPADFLIILSNIVSAVNSSVWTRNAGWVAVKPISFYSIGGVPFFYIHETGETVSLSQATRYSDLQRPTPGKHYEDWHRRARAEFAAALTTDNLIGAHKKLGSAPIFSFDGRRGSKFWVINPRLADANFPVDPQVVYSHIFNFLQAPEPAMVEAPDKYKALAHGMDMMSFKREPGGPTRKRKKL